MSGLKANAKSILWLKLFVLLYISGGFAINFHLSFGGKGHRHQSKKDGLEDSGEPNSEMAPEDYDYDDSILQNGSDYINNLAQPEDDPQTQGEENPPQLDQQPSIELPLNQDQTPIEVDEQVTTTPKPIPRFKNKFASAGRRPRSRKSQKG